MFNKKNFFIVGFLVAVFCFGLSGLALAQKAGNNFGLDVTAKAAGLNANPDLALIIGNVVGTALSLIGVIFFGLMLYGGFVWMTSRGNSEGATQGLDTITAAIIGIIIVLSAYAITNFVFNSLNVGSGGGGEAGSTTSDRDAVCKTANTNFACTEITNCDGVTYAKGDDAPTVCKAATDKCLTGKCLIGSDKDNSAIVCCKPKVETGKCPQAKIDECNASTASGLSAGSWVCDTATGSCLKKEGIACSANTECANGNKCVDGKCGVFAGGALSTYEDTSSCAAYMSNNSDRDWVGAPTACQCFTRSTKGAACTKNSDCDQGICVSSVCEAGTECSRCGSDTDCKSGYFCEYNTLATTKTCFPKTSNGNKCDENYHCLSGKCVDTNSNGSKDTCAP